MRMEMIFLFCIALTSVYCANVVSARDPSDCAELRHDEERLECYDLLFKKSPIAHSNVSHWQIRSEKSRIDDSTNVFLRVDSREPIISRYGEKVRPILYIMCRENETNISIWFGGYFMSDIQGKGDITYRIDDHSAKRKKFRESNNNEYLGMWSGHTAIPFIKEMFSGANLFVRAIPFSDSTLNIDFPIYGLKEAIKPLREACHW